jgi:DnaK suppressor protein
MQGKMAMPSPGQLSEADLVRIRRKLESIRDGLLAAERASLPPADPADEGAPDPGDDVDLAERTIEQDFRLRQTTFDAALLGDVDHALAKIIAGTYGTSEESGEPIELARLEAVPWARRTADEEERYQRARGTRP